MRQLRSLCAVAGVAALSPVVATTGAHAGGSLVLIEEAAGIVGPQAHAISGDGSRVAGTGNGPYGWVYDDASGLVPLPGFPADGRMVVEDMSFDGTHIVGQARTATAWEAFRYSAGAGMQGLGTLPPDTNSVAHAVSADGSFVVGRSNGDAFGWTQAGGIAPLPGAIGSGALPFAMSADGGVVTGSVYGAFITSGAFRWTPASGMVELTLPPGYEGLEPRAVSADGSTIAGASYDEQTETSDAFRWTVAEGPVVLGRCPGSVSAYPTDVSGDGNVIVGECWFPDGEGEATIRDAFVWTPAGGMERFHDYLASHGIDGSSILSPALTGVSDAGRVLAGYDDDVSQTRAFLVRIDAPPQVPGPGAPWLLGLAGALAGLARRWLRPGR